MKALERARLLDLATKALASATENMFYADNNEYPEFENRKRLAWEDVERALSLITKAQEEAAE